MSLKPLKDRVVAKIEKPLEKTESGILLGEAKEKPAYAVVESVGPEVKTVKKGDKIIYKECCSLAVHSEESSRIINICNKSGNDTAVSPSSKGYFNHITDIISHILRIYLAHDNFVFIERCASFSNGKYLFILRHNAVQLFTV